MPWSPRAKFSGVSVYTLDTNGKILLQEDYWDSINLKNGKYETVSVIEGIKDFTNQLGKSIEAEMAAPELPYELLRRAARYEVRKYPPVVVAETSYSQRPEGYDRLGSFVGGSNALSKRLEYFSPTLMRIFNSDGKRKKVMSWPVAFSLPGKKLPSLDSFPESTVPGVKLNDKEPIVVAVTRFDVAATEPVVKGFTNQLLSDITADGMKASESSQNGDFIVGQFDALFSVNKRRNEVWVELSDHPWVR